MSIVRFIDTKGKPFAIFLFSLIALGCLVVSTLVGTAIFIKPQALFFACCLMLLAIVFHWCGKKRPWAYLVSFGMNAVANGFSLAALYLHKGVAPDLIPMLFSAIPAAVILLLTYLMLQIWNKTKKVTLTVATVVNALALIAAFLLWKVEFFGFFALLISLFYLGVFGISINRENRAVLRDISFGSFGSFIIITLVVLVVITDGEVLDGADFDIDLSSSEKNKKKPKQK